MVTIPIAPVGYHQRKSDNKDSIPRCEINTELGEISRGNNGVNSSHNFIISSLGFDIQTDQSETSWRWWIWWAEFFDFGWGFGDWNQTKQSVAEGRRFRCCLSIMFSIWLSRVFGLYDFDMSSIHHLCYWARFSYWPGTDEIFKSRGNHYISDPKGPTES